MRAQQMRGQGWKGKEESEAGKARNIPSLERHCGYLEAQRGANQLHAQVDLGAHWGM